MMKNIRTMSVLAALLFMVFSCASRAPVSIEAPSGLSSESDGYLQRSGNESEDRMISYSVSLSLYVKNPGETRKILLDQIKDNDGFIVRETENYITTRIPAENTENFIGSARTLGKVESESKTGTDITDQYRDNVIRLESMKSVRNRYLALLERANTVSDMLTVERELERINTQIELLEGKIQHAQLSAEYSIITVRFREKPMPGIVGWIFYGLYRGVKWLFVWK